MTSILFISFVAFLSASHKINLSGNLTPQSSTSSGDTITYKFKDTSAAALTLAQPIFSVNGGVVTIDGEGHTISVDQDYCEGNSCSDLSIYFIDVTGSSSVFSLEECVFKGLSRYTTVVSASNAQELEIRECRVSGSFFMFARISNTEKLTVRECEFSDMRGEIGNPFLLYGSVLTITNCGKMTVRECDFMKIAGGAYDTAGGQLAGYGAPLLIYGSKNIKVTECKFERCTGLLAGAIFAYDQGEKGKYSEIRFSDNSYTLPLENLLEIMAAFPDAGELVNSLGNYADLGHDVTRVAGSSLKTSRLCSSSAYPHFRNDMVTENFRECGDMSAGGIVAIVLSTISMVVAAAAIVLCCCCGCCCRSCYENCCCGRYCHRQKCKQIDSFDEEAINESVYTNPANKPPLQLGCPAQDNANIPPVYGQQGLPPPGGFPQGYPQQDYQQQQGKDMTQQSGFAPQDPPRQSGGSQPRLPFPFYPLDSSYPPPSPRPEKEFAGQNLPVQPASHHLPPYPELPPYPQMQTQFEQQPFQQQQVQQLQAAYYQPPLQQQQPQPQLPQPQQHPDSYCQPLAPQMQNPQAPHSLQAQAVLKDEDCEVPKEDAYVLNYDGAE